MLSRHLHLPPSHRPPRRRSPRQAEQDERLGRWVAGGPLPISETYARNTRPLQEKRMALRPERSEVGRITLVVWDSVRAYDTYIQDKKGSTFADLPEEYRKILLRLTEALITNPGVQPNGLHREWSREMREAGWDYGPKLDIDGKKHPLLRAWQTLSDAEKRKDQLIIAIVQTLTGFV